MSTRTAGARKSGTRALATHTATGSEQQAMRRIKEALAYNTALVKRADTGQESKNAFYRDKKAEIPPLRAELKRYQAGDFQIPPWRATAEGTAVQRLAAAEKNAAQHEVYATYGIGVNHLHSYDQAQRAQALRALDNAREVYRRAATDLSMQHVADATAKQAAKQQEAASKQIRQAFADAAKHNPEAHFKFHGPAPILGAPRVRVNLAPRPQFPTWQEYRATARYPVSEKAYNADVSKKLRAYDRIAIPAQKAADEASKAAASGPEGLRRAAYNSDRVRALRGRVHDLAIDLNQADRIMRSKAPGTVARRTATARLRALEQQSRELLNEQKDATAAEMARLSAKSARANTRASSGRRAQK